MKWIILCVLSILMFHSVAFADESAEDKKIPIGGDSDAGEVSSGGGSAIVCRNPQGDIVGSPQVLDLYESSFTLPVPSGDLLEDYITAVRRSYFLMGYDVAPVSEQTIETDLNNFFKLVQFTNENEYLVLMDDIGVSEMNLAKGCLREQVAIFFDKTPNRAEYVVIDSEIWNAMDSLNQAALVSHETIYKNDRALGDETSKMSRETVAYIYSTDEIERAMSGIPQSHQHCVTEVGFNFKVAKSNTFYVYPEQSGYTLQFSRLMGRDILAKATVSLPYQFDLRRGDPTGKTQHNKLVVWEEGAQEVLRIPLEGSQYENMILELEYKYNETFKFSLYREGKLLEKAETASCLRKN